MNHRNPAKKAVPLDQGRPLKPSDIARIQEVLDVEGKRVRLAASLGLSESRISEYMAGKRSPTPEGWISLGKLALKYRLADPVYFWEKAGVDRHSLRGMADEIRERQSGAEGGVFPIPRFRETLQGREEAGAPIPLPAEFIPNPDSTVCLAVDYKATAVVDSPRAVFILDESESHGENLLPFWDQVVFIRHRPSSGTQQGLQAPPGIYMGRIKLSVPVRLTAAMTFQGMVRLVLVYGRNAPSPLLMARFEYACPDDIKGIDPNLDEAYADLRVISAWHKAKERALKEVRLDRDWQILGRVLGRLKLEGMKNG